MKITRTLLLAIVAGLGVLIIVYTLIQHFTSFGLGAAAERHIMDFIMIAAVGLLMYNRKIAKDEKRAKEAALEAERRAEEDPEEVVSPEDENLPHWERYKKSADDSSNDEQ